MAGTRGVYSPSPTAALNGRAESRRGTLSRWERCRTSSAWMMPSGCFSFASGVNAERSARAGPMRWHVCAAQAQLWRLWGSVCAARAVGRRGRRSLQYPFLARGDFPRTRPWSLRLRAKSGMTNEFVIRDSSGMSITDEHLREPSNGCLTVRRANVRAADE